MKLLFTAIAFQLPVLLFSQQVNLDSLNKAIKQKKQDITGKPFHKFMYTTDRANVSNNDLEGKVVFINFWYASCAPCMAEMEALNKLYDTFSVNPRFKFLSFTFEKKVLFRK